MKALLVIDIQNDFCPGGSLAVEKGDRIIPVVNQLYEAFEHLIFTQDWHPEAHHSFASVYENKQAYETIEMPYGMQVLWPDHCVKGTKGAAFHPDLKTENAALIIRKGFRKQIDSYSAFFENDQKTPTGLSGYLKNRGIEELFICGLATDFCVKWSALDGINEGFKITVIEDAVAGIDLEGSVAKAWQEMENAGVQKMSAAEAMECRI